MLLGVVTAAAVALAAAQLMAVAVHWSVPALLAVVAAGLALSGST